MALATNLLRCSTEQNTALSLHKAHKYNNKNHKVMKHYKSSNQLTCLRSEQTFILMHSNNGNDGSRTSSQC